MENKILGVIAFEKEQLDCFENHEIVISLKQEIKRLLLDVQIGISKIEDFNPQECSKMKLLHGGFLFFEVLFEEKPINLKIADFGCLSWSQLVTSVKKNGKVNLYSWTEDKEFIEEIERVISYLKQFEDSKKFSEFYYSHLY